jgi:hypothetical protein
MRRKQNFQTIAWFWDLHQRGLLDVEPPYQRRSVWNQAYKDYFIDTILLGYPAPAIFLYEEIDPDGKTLYHVVDGKQRLMTIFDFAENRFPVAEEATVSEYHDRYFRDLPDEVKRDFWGYPFSVEYIPTEDETIIDNVFDRINRNTAKLTAQELRHAKYSGEFISTAEELSEWMAREMSDTFPNIAPKSRRQMKDVELVAHILLLLERGPRGYSTADLDSEFSSRDEEWEQKLDIERRFRQTVAVLVSMLRTPEGEALQRSRLRNQADFYSLFGAIDRILQEGGESLPEEWTARALSFSARADDEQQRESDAALREYYEAARSASNDTGPRQTRVNLLKRVLQDLPLAEE